MPRPYALDLVAEELRPIITRTPAVRFERVWWARTGVRLMHWFMPRVDARGVTVRDVRIPSASGAHRVRVRLYEPAGAGGAAPPRPAMVFMHWGGFVVGGLQTEHARCVWLCREFGMVVASVEYRLAPEHPFPAGLDDCFAALRWLLAHAPAIGGAGVDPTRIAVGGTSAGGGLAAALAIRARDHGIALALQYLGFPVLDASGTTASAQCYTDTPNWTARANTLMWRYYLQGRPATALAAPLLATDLRGLAPAVLWTAEFDPLHDEGQQYARRLTAAGVETYAFDYPGTVHGFDSMPVEGGVVAQARRDQIAVIRRLLRTAGDA